MKGVTTPGPGRRWHKSLPCKGLGHFTHFLACSLASRNGLSPLRFLPIPQPQTQHVHSPLCHPAELILSITLTSGQSIPICVNSLRALSNSVIFLPIIQTNSPLVIRTHIHTQAHVAIGNLSKPILCLTRLENQNRPIFFRVSASITDCVKSGVNQGCSVHRQISSRWVIYTLYRYSPTIVILFPLFITKFLTLT